MAQPSVAREPSMEEILASIRRIIESNEPAVEGAAPRDFTDYDDDIEIAPADQIDFGPDMAANDPGVPMREPAPSRPAVVSPHLSAHQQPSAAAAIPERSLSLADVAARVRAASGRAPEPLDVAAPARAFAEFSQQPAPRQPLPPIPELGPAAVEPAFAGVDAERTMAARPPEATVEPRMPEIESVSAPTAQPELKNAAPVAEARPESLPAKIEVAANLMSVEAGAQVARSFGELAEVFDGIDHQSLEDMAQDMLRPMLQEWLDDNLPTLVERLVREEIERVARGPRR